MARPDAGRGADEIVRDGKSLAAAGGAEVILSASNSTESMVDTIQGLRPNRHNGAEAEPRSISPMDLISKRIRIFGTSKTAPNISTKPLTLWRREGLKRWSRRTH